NTSTHVDSQPVTTDFFGRYAFPAQPSGTYQLRWDAQLGWAAGQHPDLIVIANGTQYPVPAHVVAAQTNGVIYGQVKFADGDTAWHYDELFSEKHTATVTVLNLARTVTYAGPIHANAMTNGNHYVYLEVKDGQGGYARQRVSFAVNQTCTTFSGLT